MRIPLPSWKRSAVATVLTAAAPVNGTPIAVPGIVLQPAVTVHGPANAGTDGDALAYRFGAIVRHRVQRVERGDPQHDDHDLMTGEAIGIAAELLKRGAWTMAKFDAECALLREAG